MNFSSDTHTYIYCWRDGEAGVKFGSVFQCVCVVDDKEEAGPNQGFSQTQEKYHVRIQ